MSNDRAVYVIQQVLGAKRGPFKVGIATDVKHRLKNLQVGSPEPLVLTWLIQPSESAKSLEKTFHCLLGDYRLCGEWFSVDGEPLLERLLEKLSVGASPQIASYERRWGHTRKAGYTLTGNDKRPKMIFPSIFGTDISLEAKAVEIYIQTKDHNWSAEESDLATELGIDAETMSRIMDELRSVGALNESE